MDNAEPISDSGGILFSMSKRSRRMALRTSRQSRSGRSSSDTPVLRASSIPDLLGSIPAMFGFHPSRSLVVIAMKGKRVHFQVRTDLPGLKYVDACAQNLMPTLLDQEPDGVLLVAYVEPQDNNEVHEEERLAADGLVESIRGRLRAENIEVREAVRCDGTRYWSYLCDNEACCPSVGTPYAIESTSTMANAVFNGLEVLPDRGALERRFGPVQGQLRGRMEEATAEAVAEISEAHGIFLGGETVADRFHIRRTQLLRAGADYVEGLLGDLDPRRAETLSDDHAARLMVWMRLLPVRDLAWSYITEANAEDHLALWTAVVRRAVPPFEPAPLCLAGFSAWRRGSGAQAACAIGRVVQIAPDYSLGNLLGDLLERCVPPSAWHEFDDAVIQAPFGSRADDVPTNC